MTQVVSLSLFVGGSPLKFGRHVKHLYLLTLVPALVCSLFSFKCKHGYLAIGCVFKVGSKVKTLLNVTCKQVSIPQFAKHGKRRIQNLILSRCSKSGS